MSFQQIGILVFVVCTVIYAVSASQGYVYAANIWKKGKLMWRALGKSGLGFAGSVVAYWLALRYLTEFGVLAAEFQILICFAITIIGVALVSGRFFKWQALDQMIAVVVLCGIAWLLVRQAV